MTMIIQAFYQADLLGKGIFLLLFALSILSWFIIIYKTALLTKVGSLSTLFYKSVQQKKDNLLCISSDLPKIQGIPLPFTHIYLDLKNKAIKQIEKNRYFHPDTENVYLSSTDLKMLARHADSLIIKQQEGLSQYLHLLATTITLSPFLGLLGTVWGILTAFDGQTIGSGQQALHGLSMALTTTALGLFIAVPALVGYNYLKNKVRRYYVEMENFSHYLLSNIELQYRKADPPQHEKTP